MLTLFVFLFLGEIPGHISQAVASLERPESDRVRDANRKPGEVLAFFEIEPGDHVVDCSGGQGYYTDILARAVGPKGKVTLHNVPFVLNRFKDNFKEGSLFHTRLQSKAWQNVTRLDAPFDAPNFAPNQDCIMTVLFYHDTFWQEVDREKMNQAIFDALKPGGVYGIVDHSAEEGSGARDVNTLHRVDKAIVIEEILAAGFEFVAESDILANPNDSRDYNVFRDFKTNRDQTDRFILKFRKPQ